MPVRYTTVQQKYVQPVQPVQQNALYYLYYCTVESIEVLATEGTSRTPQRTLFAVIIPSPAPRCVAIEL